METELKNLQKLEVSIAPPFDKAIARLKDAFKAEGFGTLSEIDVSKTLQEKIGEQIEPYTILGMCNPHLAFRAVKLEHEIGLFLPCNVLIHECDGQVHVKAQDPTRMMQMVANAKLDPIAEEAKSHVECAIDSLRQAG